MECYRKIMGSLISLVLCLASSNSLAYIVCESGYNKYGGYAPCLKSEVVKGRLPNRVPIENPNEGQPERIDKHIDGSISVWITGNPEPQEWKPDGKDSWVRTR